MMVLLNGEATNAQEARNVAELAQRFGMEPNVTLVEHNGVALRQREWHERMLAEGDRLEFVRVVAGG